jgi:cyclopropane fatty-acyl-phospholipid synthase-like methyltransferase
MDSASEYERNANEFLSERDKSWIGAKVIRQWAKTFSNNSTVLELACGGGYPVTKELIDAGIRLWAIDSSSTLISEFRSRYPDVEVRCERVQDSDFFARTFDGVIAIGLLFLLKESQQKQLINKVANILVTGGRFLFTAPTQTGSFKDMNTGLECLSLGRNKYEEVLNNSGFRVIGTYDDEGKNNYYETEMIN